MASRLQHWKIIGTLRQFLAILLICLMVPGSVANASSWVWCFAGSEHVAIEMHGGTGSHEGFNVHDVHADGSAHDDISPERNVAYEDCIDVELLPTVFLTRNRSIVDEFGQPTKPEIERHALLGNQFPSLAPHSSLSPPANCEFQIACRVDPAVQLRRITSLRI